LEELDSTPTNKEEVQVASPGKEKELSFDELIVYLNKLYDQANNTIHYQKSLLNYEDKIKMLQQQLENLEVENEKLSKELHAMEYDYKALIEIMERARKMVVLKDEEFAQKARFQMDKNGNLEKLDK